MIGEEVFIPTFSIASSADWKINYARDSRIDIAQRCAAKTAKELAAYEEECGWRVIMPAVTSAFTGKGLLGSRPAPIYEINPASTGAGYFSKELINKMMVGFTRIGRKLTDLYLSPEAMADVREWTDYKSSRPIWKQIGEKLVNSVKAPFFGSRRVIPSQVCV